MSRRPCLVCDGAFSPAAGLPGLLRCAGCGFVSADVEVSEEELRGLYAENYFRGAEYADYLADRRTIEKQFRIRLAQLLRYVPAERRGRLFEIGCAYGFFLGVARGEFREVAGIDISQAAIEWARAELGVAVTCGDFAKYEFAASPDVVCLWDTIEHVARPELYVEKLSRSMTAGSVLAVTTGDIGSLVARVRGKRWRQIHPPTHLHYFSKETLGRLLGRHGFRVVYSGSDGMYRSLETMAYILFKQKGTAPWVYEGLRAMGVLGYDLYLNLGDIVFVVAVKGERRCTR